MHFPSYFIFIFKFLAEDEFKWPERPLDFQLFEWNYLSWVHFLGHSFGLSLNQNLSVCKCRMGQYCGLWRSSFGGTNHFYRICALSTFHQMTILPFMKNKICLIYLFDILIILLVMVYTYQIFINIPFLLHLYIFPFWAIPVFMKNKIRLYE